MRGMSKKSKRAGGDDLVSTCNSFWRAGSHGAEAGCSTAKMCDRHTDQPPLATGLAWRTHEDLLRLDTIPARWNDTASVTPPLVAKLPRYAVGKGQR
jgi:hypothetical protein